MVVAFWPIAAAGLYPPSYYLFAGLFLVCVIYYFVVKMYNERRGINLTLAFKELPPL